MAFGLQEGTIFAGRYKVLRCIAVGGMGAVYEVLHLETERRRALKVMLPQMLQSPELRDRFRREARVAAKVDSEFIVDVFDAGVDDATEMPFLVMELLKGEEIGKLLKRQGKFAPADVVTYLKQTAMALDKTHQASIVHRDLKPDNLFLTYREDGAPHIKVLDFGIAKIVADSGTAAGGTRSLGTPLYMPPEQFNPEARLTPAADIFALGMMAYTLLVGAAYWADEAKSGNLLTFAMATAHGPVDPASGRAAARGVLLPPAFDAWFARVTAKDPAHRFPSASVAIAALAEVLGTPLPRTSFASMEQSGPPPATTPAGISQSGISQSGDRAAPVLTAGAPTPVGASLTGAQPEPRAFPKIAAALAIGLAVIGGGIFVFVFVFMGSPSAATGVPVAADSTIVTTTSTPAPSSAAPPLVAPLVTTSEPVAPAPSTPAPAKSAKVVTAAPQPSEKAIAKPLGSSPQKKPTKPTYSQD